MVQLDSFEFVHTAPDCCTEVGVEVDPCGTRVTHLVYTWDDGKLTRVRVLISPKVGLLVGRISVARLIHRLQKGLAANRHPWIIQTLCFFTSSRAFLLTTQVLN